MSHSHPQIIDPIKNEPKEFETPVKILIFPKWFIAIPKDKIDELYYKNIVSKPSFETLNNEQKQKGELNVEEK